jgi:hypothetical protein
MSGTLVRRRISEELYKEALNSLMEAAATGTVESAALLPKGRMPLLRYPPGKGPLYEWSKRWT